MRDLEPWLDDALAALRAAYPTHNWRKDEDELALHGEISALPRPTALSIEREPEDDGWYRAAVFLGDDEAVEGLGRDPLSALRSAARRANVLL